LTDAAGRITTLVGHFPRSHAQAARLRESPRATLLILGPHGYISPSWMQDRTQAPTWNYASAQFAVDVELVDEAPALETHLNDLVNAMEAGGPRPWRVAETASRYESLSRRIVMFRAHVRDLRAKFKLGQDERDDVYQDIVAGLDRAQGGELLSWMSGFNPDRPAR
jgi:transcriptional regulator